ncbi:MAG: Gx transporter family protein [Oscillospiraceae bacterium]|nr:Gx transporter family protein [Oscillospiraceae bacterium]
MNARRIAELGMLTGLALILFIIELRLPNLTPVPGVKLGLANIVTVYAVFHYAPQETALLVLSRIVLGAIFAANPASLLYSAAGAAFCLCGMLSVRGFLSEQQIWLASVLGAVLHNVGQITAAVLMMQTFAVIGYLPVLLFSGCIAGFVTGMAAQFLLRRKNL